MRSTALFVQVATVRRPAFLRYLAELPPPAESWCRPAKKLLRLLVKLEHGVAAIPLPDGTPLSITARDLLLRVRCARRFIEIFARSGSETASTRTGEDRKVRVVELVGPLVESLVILGKLSVDDAGAKIGRLLELFGIKPLIHRDARSKYQRPADRPFQWNLVTIDSLYADYRAMVRTGKRPAFHMLDILL
ncbi:MAG: hypothetical protein HYY25_01160 [Candidatus Wallbacteria bacterium]|nr:hypothetical protein [Candidatus Wallbacteria bacterium]